MADTLKVTLVKSPDFRKTKSIVQRLRLWDLEN